jgi:sulfite reductase (NADPH) flavoprotein alpha-component
MKIDLPDLLKIYPVKDITQFEEVLGILNLQSPRLYTISSSPSAHTGEVHITVAKDEFVINAEKKYGVCSDFLCQVAVNDELNFFIQKNKRFRLPADETTDIIMIGPGTGIAPFRSFVAERDATGATGKNWLFFGDQHFVTDFLYQTEWQNWLSTGVLTKIDLAFSRDQKEKVYVQHKIKQQAKELTAWIDNGAHLYLCGAKDPMSVDVEQTLIGIIGEQKSLSYDQATEFLNELKESGRYHKDVY